MNCKTLGKQEKPRPQNSRQRNNKDWAKIDEIEIKGSIKHKVNSLEINAKPLFRLAKRKRRSKSIKLELVK